MKAPTKAFVHALGILVAVSVVAACSADVSGSATTFVQLGPTNFVTIPPVQTTLVPTTTTLPIGAVGVEQNYTVRQGDSPSLVAQLFGITMSELLAYNGLVASAQFPYPGSVLRIPPTAMVLNPEIVVAPNVSAPPSAPGCDPRPAGTYQVAAGDSIFAIRRKFCVSLASLLSANGWNYSNANIYQGQIINIPAAGS